MPKRTKFSSPLMTTYVILIIGIRLLRDSIACLLNRWKKVRKNGEQNARDLRVSM
uniref:Uncharacterized protein n=1 Tax=Lepeophtheirus salmonis TaxID=72036 RepID=A0A0K2V7G8_LEPSM